jgi:hypothetical protein
MSSSPKIRRSAWLTGGELTCRHGLSSAKRPIGVKTNETEPQERKQTNGQGDQKHQADERHQYAANGHQNPQPPRFAPQGLIPSHRSSFSIRLRVLDCHGRATEPIPPGPGQVRMGPFSKVPCIHYKLLQPGCEMRPLQSWLHRCCAVLNPPDDQESEVS